MLSTKRIPASSRDRDKPEKSFKLKVKKLKVYYGAYCRSGSAKEQKR
jgi:hypothetical protein